jgi:hypothetical protein
MAATFETRMHDIGMVLDAVGRSRAPSSAHPGCTCEAEVAPGRSRPFVVADA